MNSPEPLQAIFNTVDDLSPLDRMRLVAHLVAQSRWQRVGLEEQDAYAQELAQLDRGQLLEALLGQWLTLRHSAAKIEQLSAELTQLNAQLNAQLERVREGESAERSLRTQFLASLCHELRTPINSIVNFAKLLGREKYGDLNEQQTDFQQRIVSNGELCLEMVAELYDLAKLDAGRLELSRREVQFLPLLQGVSSTAQGSIRDRDIQLIIEVPEDLPAIFADKARIRQVLLNLLVIACQTMDQGAIVLKVSQKDQYLSIEMESTGAAIPEEYHSLMFEVWPEIEGLYKYKYKVGALGYGLPICKALIELHGGTICLENTPNQSTKYCFTLPIAQPDEAS